MIGIIGFAFLSADTGFINNTILRTMGKESVSWYMQPNVWPLILVLVFLWKNAGYQSIIYMASISGFDKSIYEAASIDGASKLKQIFSITLPCCVPTITILTLMAVGRIFFSDLGLFYTVPQFRSAVCSYPDH